MLRVLLGSHEAGERHQWRQWLSEAPLEVVGLAQDGQEAVQLALQLRPDLVLLDQGLPVLKYASCATVARAPISISPRE